MKLNELLESIDGKKLYDIARTVGQREFGSSSQGLVMTKYNGVKQIKFNELTDEDEYVGTYAWIFYPSNPRKFKDYSDSLIKKVEPDTDGKIYMADSDGKITIISNAPKRTFTVHPHIDLKALKGKTIGQWQVTHVELYDEDRDWGPKEGEAKIYLKISKNAEPFKNLIKTPAHGPAEGSVSVQKDGNWKAHFYYWPNHINSKTLKDYNGSNFNPDIIKTFG